MVFSSAKAFCSEKRLTTLVTYSRPATRRMVRASGWPGPPRRRCISSARIFSRSSATRLMRCLMLVPPELPRNEKPRVKTTAAAATAANAVMRKSRVINASIAPITASEVELDHAVHDEQTDAHHHRGDAQPDEAEGRCEQ